MGSRADWVANILLYLVLAYFVTGAVWVSRLTSALRTMLLVLMLGACLALAVGIEYLQLFFPPRTVSLNDLLAEGLGTVLGTMVWFMAGRRIAATWERFIHGGASSLRALLALYAIGYLGLSFFPYDFLVSGAELSAKFAKPDSFSIGPGLACGSSITCGVKLVVEALLALPFGVLLALGWRVPRRPVGAPAPSPSKTVIWGLVAGAALGATIEGVQIVLASGNTQIISIFTRSLGVAWGVVLAQCSVAALASVASATGAPCASGPAAHLPSTCAGTEWSASTAAAACLGRAGEARRPAFSALLLSLLHQRNGGPAQPAVRRRHLCPTGHGKRPGMAHPAWHDAHFYRTCCAAAVPGHRSAQAIQRRAAARPDQSPHRRRKRRSAALAGRAHVAYAAAHSQYGQHAQRRTCHRTGYHAR